MREKKKHNSIIILLILLLSISLGYALLSTTLKINGSSVIKSSSWRIYWDAPTDKTASATTTVVKEAQLKETSGVTDNTTVEFEVTLGQPGDYYEFYVDAVNAGSIDAMVTDIVSTVKVNGQVTTLPDYIKYDITYADGNPVRKYHMLKKASSTTNFTKEKYKVRVEFLKSVTVAQLNGMTGNVTYTFEYNVTYGQTNDYAYDRTYSDLEFLDGYGPQGPFKIGDTMPSTGYSTNDYTTLLDSGNNQKLSFCAAKLDGDRKITNGYACGIFDGELVCIEGPDESVMPKEKEKLLSIFGEYDDTTKTGCREPLPDESTYGENIYYCFKNDTCVAIMDPTPGMSFWLSINNQTSLVIENQKMLIPASY